MERGRYEILIEIEQFGGLIPSRKMNQPVEKVKISGEIKANTYAFTNR